jgi:4-amino-4-deoxy-L-arabinose transferase-like glycosyltransferase
VRAAALLAAFVAFPLALALRVHNAITYPPDWGFDGSFNWQYIEALRRVWHLPAPDAGWSTSDPPLYFALAALLMRALPAPALVPWLNLLFGLGIAAIAAWLVRRLAPGDGARALLAAGLVLYLPAHVQMSAMVNEEMLASAFIALAIALAADPARRDEPPGPALRRALGAGTAAGLALLSKLSGALATPASAAAWLYDARRGRAQAALSRAALCCALAALVGGWFYARNRIVYGYFQPHDLAVHGQLMWSMPPGQRGVADFLRFPLATFADPQVLNPELLRSVWGTTYASLWFDAHRMFLPTHDEGVRRLGSATLLLALLPTAAFLAGLVAGVRRCLRGEGAADAPLCALVALTLAGYALYAWQNPWFAVLKGTSLLGLCVPYGVYASESLCRWSRRGHASALAIGALLAALAACVIAGGAFQLLFVRSESPGIPWLAPVSP